MKTILNRINNYLLLMRFYNPVGTLLLLWPTLWGLWIANDGLPDLKVLLVFIIGVFLMRSVGCVINDLADRNFDGNVERTKNRPLVTSNKHKKVRLNEAYSLVVVLCFLALLLVLSLNNLQLIYHSCIALVLASIYPLCKRWFVCPQFVLGLAFGYAIPMGYVASYVNFSIVTWLLYSSSIIMTVIYDNFYAMADLEHDRKIKIYSSVMLFQHLFGEYDLWFVASLQAILLVNLTIVAYIVHLQWLYIMLVIIIGIFIYQLQLAKTRNPDKCLRAFKSYNLVGCMIFLGIALS